MLKDNGQLQGSSMLFLLSPAKSLDYEPPAGDIPHTPPLFARQSAELIAVLRQQSPQQNRGHRSVPPGWCR